MATIKQIKDTEGNVHDILSTIGYGTCTTAGETAAKVATIDDTSWTLKVGSIIGIKFTNTNTAGSTTTPVTLNINNTGAKNIWYSTSKYTSTSSNICGYANRVIYYMYDGTYWVWMNSGALDGNSNTVPCIQIETAAATADKVGTCTNYSLLAKSYAHANVRYTNSAQSALTLNVNSKGAKPIYINGTASSASNYTLPAGTYIIYYDGTNYHFRTDGKLSADITGNAEYAEHAGSAEYAESCDRAIISDLAIGDENGNNIISTYVTRSDFGSLTDHVDRIESDFTGFTNYVEETFSKTMLSVTHSQLVNLRDNGKLIPGQQYRITDYVTTVSTALNEISAGNQFDIIVTADSENILNEEARAIQNDNDTYFNDSNLSAWKIWYSLDNDEDRFNWANEDGYGVIYRMIDEYGNDCPYDFKNIKFKNTNNYEYYYTFSWVDERNNVCDSSILGNTTLLTDEGLIQGVYNNVIKEYYNDNHVQCLNNIIFISEYLYDGGLFYGCYNNTFGNNCYENTFGSNCYENTFGNYCGNNTFGNYCGNNTFGNNCNYNTFGNRCYNNKFGSECINNNLGTDCYSNTFGSNCYENTFGTDCYRNTFGTDCTYNTFGDVCYNNTFGNNCYENTFGSNCYENTFGNYCGNNTFGNYCGNNTFGTDCYNNKFSEGNIALNKGCNYNTFGGACHNNTFGTECNYNTFGSNCYNNVFGTVNSNNELAGSCSRNKFGTNCYNNKLSNSCQNNSFDIDCHDNEFGASCTYNKFDTLCAVIKFGSNCSYNTLGNGCTNITFGTSSVIRSYYRRIIIDNGNRYIYLNCGTSGSSKYYQNVRIGLGVNNTNTYKTIADGNINQTFETYYKPSESQTILI